ncbi:MAG: hypoxanthine phosphoribosyltransferase [Bradymonadia bacterium]|jgi:hypoxanthine phosphoribosyltransferase
MPSASDAVITPLLTEEQIAERVRELGREISSAFEGKNLILVCVLKGSIPFFADLARCIETPVQFDTVAIHSYEGTSSTGNVRFGSDLSLDITGRDVLVVEDIVDTGTTMKALLDVMKARGAASIGVVSLLDKPSRRKTPVEIDFLGFSIEDKFVVGYGLDYNQHFRNLPYVGVLEEIPEGL